MFRTWHTKLFAPAKTYRRSGAPRRRAARPTRLRLERLEDRTAPAVVTPFAPRFSINTTGDVLGIANTLETASTVNNPGRTQQDVINAQNGVGPNVNNNNWNMALVDVDNDPTTFDSSQGSLIVPVGATILWAGLYWGSVVTTPAQVALLNSVKFSTPVSGGYVSLTGSVVGSTTDPGSPTGTIYQGFANVTSLVQAGGGGVYEVANVQATPESGSYAGWALVVVARIPGAPARNLTVFDGFAVQGASDLSLNIPISGFIAPPAGAVNVKVGVAAYEGDLGITGDSMALNGKLLSDAVNPANNFFDSVISHQGVLETGKFPNYVNQMGFDAKFVNAPAGAVPNSATSATVTFSTSGDGYFPGVVTTSIDLFAPNLVATKTVTDLNGGNSLPGDTLQYTVNVTNSGQDPAGNVVLTDPIPANATYVPGSMQIVTGANAGAKTDAAGDDQATFDAAHNQLIFDLGTGATATAGGTLAIGAATSITFRVKINSSVAANTVITNQATVDYIGVTTGFSFTSLSNAPAFTVANSVADLAVTKTVSDPTPTIGDNVTFSVKVTNNGPGPATGVEATDLLPPGLQLANAITSQGAYDGGSGLWAVGSLPIGGSATLTIIATVISPDEQTNTATISNSNSIDPNSSNNQASASETPQRARPTLVTSPTPATVTLGTTPVTLTDTAVLANGYHPTGTITFTLVGPGGATVDTETVTVNGNGTYSTPTGFTLPTGGTVTGTYQWDATYSGDSSNNLASDIGDTDEEVTVSRASPTLTTTPSPTAVTLGANPVILTDSATLAGGFNPTGTITFTLFHDGSATPVDTETVIVTGNGTYTIPAGFTLPTTGTVTGTYQWDATYSGDGNNTAVSDNNAANEQVAVSAATPALTTAPSPTTIVLGAATPPSLTDSATLANGYHPTGPITFKLVAPGGATVDTETVTANGDGTYSTPTGFTLPGSGTVTGTYQWDATYSGDTNNNAASDLNDVNEQVTVSKASPTLVTTASPNVTLPAGPPGTVTLTDTADLEGGFNQKGSIVFTLTGPGGATVDTETVTVNGNGTYTTPTGFTLPTTGTVVGTYTWTAHYTGDGNDNAANDQAGIAEQTVVSPAIPTLTTTPSPSTPAIGATLKDTAVLAGGYHPTGTITFTLFFNGGTTPIDTETVTVNGNGSYTTPTGSIANSATGPYQWDATYSGDTNNTTVSDINSPNEQVPPTAFLTLTTTPSPATVRLGTNSVTLKDTANLIGGVNPTGPITFKLVAPGGATVDTETVTANGDGTYSTPTGFTLPGSGTVTGTYQWDATYSGDTNNPAASDLNNANEQVTVSAASPGLVTIASPSSVTLGTNPLPLKDLAILAGGYHPTGTITFTLVGPGGGVVDTETATVNGNGLYRTPTGFTLPSTGTAVGTYQWNATYNGDPNNNTARDLSPVTEQVTVNPARPTLTTSPNPNTVTLGTTSVTLTDSAVVAGGFNPTGTITFTLFYNGGTTPVDTEKVAVNGNGTYTTPTGFAPPATGTVTGTYQWDASYSGDTNNDAASDVGATNEQVTVSAASPAITTTPSPTTVALTATTPPTLTDSAVLSGGSNPTGTIIFRLFFDGDTTPVDTEVASVNGNGTYTTPTAFTLPTAGVVVGTYQWDATYSGDGNNIPVSDNNAANEQVTVTGDTPTFSTTPNPTTVTLGTSSVTLTDSATLSGGFNPTGRIFFVLFKVGSGAPLDIEALTINGNGTYTTPTGFTLPTTGTVTGTYQWDASYSGDFNNSPVVENDAANEQVTVNPASPTLETTADPSVPLGTTAPTLSDSAVLSDGYFPSGSIVFTLTGPGNFSYTQTDPVSGDRTYTASTLLPTTGTVAGTYTWTATYEGDDNNNAADDQGGIAEQTVVSPASPTLVTLAGAAFRRGTAAPTLTDMALLSGGYFPTGDIVFTLSGPGGFSFTQTDTVSGDRTYTASATLPTTGTVAGTYTWTAHYTGDGNNNPGNDQGGTEEQAVVSPASPTLTTTASPNTIDLGGRMQDVAALSGGFDPTGTITFRLYAPGVDPAVGPAAYAETVTVAGDGTYHTAVGFVANALGTWHWVATYNGDPNNDPESSGPLDEPVPVPSQADIVLTKAAQPIQEMYGQDVSFTLIVHNKGPGTATDVFVDDPLPPGLGFVSAAVSQGTFAAGTGLWVVGTLANGATATLQVTDRVAAFGTLVNRAEAGADQFDPNLSNDVASATVTGTNPAPIISKRFFLASAFREPAPAPPPAPPLPALSALRADVLFVEGLYLNELGRPATPAQLAYWVNLLLLGVSPSQVARRV